MTHIVDAPEDFARIALRGFCEIYPDLVRPVEGGVLRATATSSDKVRIVIGGGSGHYPAFAGYVGRGLADAAVVGDVFASPATRVIAGVARKATDGSEAGILLGFGNYAGDVLNFGFAAERLRGDGADVRVLAVTDDIASAKPDRASERRGVCGDLSVFKIAGASAERGDPIDTVERVARAANEATFTFGIAFGGCTLPGAETALFEVPAGRMALGLGIHGETGVDETEIASATDIAVLFIDRVVAERPENTSGRAAVIVNGLGGTKHEELFVLWSHIKSGLEMRGVTIVAPLVGEYITSLDMEGCSLTITWLDDELETLWTAPCETPAMRVGMLPAADKAPPLGETDHAIKSFPESDNASRALGVSISKGIAILAQALADAEESLGRIDAVAGDGDHGQGMARGSAAARQAAQDAASRGAGASSVLATAADGWADRAGGTSGAIWGLGLRSAAATLSDMGPGSREQLVEAARNACDNILTLGRARPGDKTLVDALVPFVERLSQGLENGESVGAAWSAAAGAAEKAAEATRDLSPKLGRARPLAARSIGHRDAGAVSLALAARTVAPLFGD